MISKENKTRIANGELDAMVAEHIARLDGKAVIGEIDNHGLITEFTEGDFEIVATATCKMREIIGCLTRQQVNMLAAVSQYESEDYIMKLYAYGDTNEDFAAEMKEQDRLDIWAIRSK